jgi:outer membrane receptor protein involved in Fe transport
LLSPKWAEGGMVYRNEISLATLATLIFAASSGANAQTPQGGSPTAQGVVVTADRPAARTSIDRTVFDVAHDLQSGAGSVSDVLRNLPSVDVDVQGNVSLRGDSNVQILIDGKPSTMMSPANRAAILQQMQASSIESIEVMTNPSAQFKPDGSSGLINIITKKNRQAGSSGSVQASAGNRGRYTVGVGGARNSEHVNIFGNATLRGDKPKRTTTDDRLLTDAATGLRTRSNQLVINQSERQSRVVSGGLEISPNKQDKFSTNLSYNNRSGTPDITEWDSAGPMNGALTSNRTRVASGDEREISTEASGEYRHSFAEKGHEFTLSVQRGETSETQNRLYRNVFLLPSAPATIDEQRLHFDNRERELSAEYIRPFKNEAKLVLGYDLQRDDEEYNNYGGVIDAVSNARTLDPAQTNDFRYNRTIHALYSTYEQPLGKWTALAGLRLEQVYIDTNQITSALSDSNQYFRAYPTLHLQRDITDSQALRFSYSTRVIRPEADDLNPYRVFQDAFNYRAGNPRLLPQEIKSLEAGYQFRKDGRNFSATAYYRRTSNSFTTVSTYITPTVLLTTEANIGSSTAGGVELAASGKVSEKLGVNLSGNVFYNQVDAANLGIAAKRSATGYTAKGSLDYRLTEDDLFQLSASYNGKRLTAQGYRQSSPVANFGYRRKIRDDLAATLTVADVFNSQRDRSFINTATIQDVTERRQQGRTALLGLSWQFGGGKKGGQDQFDFSN